MRIKVKGLAPKYSNKYAAGLDLYNNDEDIIIRPDTWASISSKLAVEIPDGYFGMIIPRSGLGCRGIGLVNTVGIIDSDYRGEIGIKLVNTSVDPIEIRKGDRVAQMVIVPFARVEIEEVEELSETERGHNGFGSTGR